jgi:hypothetical protein
MEKVDCFLDFPYMRIGHCPDVIAELSEILKNKRFYDFSPRLSMDDYF